MAGSAAATQTAPQTPQNEPIVKTGGSTDLTSFDELEAVTQPVKTPRKALDNSEPGSQKKEPGKTDGKSEKASKGKESDGSEENSEDGKEGSKSEEEKSAQKGKEKPKDGKEAAKADKPVKNKIFKIKNGDQEIELRSDSQFEVNIDGQKQSVSAQDLVNEFSGKTAWNKKFSELDTERKQFQNQQKELESGIQNWVNLSGSDPIAAIEYACEMSGMDSRKFVQDIRAQFKQAFEQYAELTPEERKEREILDERDYYKTKTEKAEADRFNQRQKAELEKRVKATQQKFNLDPSRYLSRYEELQNLKAQGQISDDLTPELVGTFHQEMEQRKIVFEIINDVAADIPDKVEASKELKALWEKDTSLTAQQLRQIATQVYGSDAARKLSRKVKKSNPDVQQTSTQKAVTSHVQPLFFDDL